MTERTFVNLKNGSVPFLLLAVCPGATQAKRSEPTVGIFRLDGERFREIARHIMNSMGSHYKSLDEVAVACDEIGIENRFFRMNAEVGRWIDETDPEPTEIDYIVM